jgi:hypothetical protein
MTYTQWQSANNKRKQQIKGKLEELDIVIQRRTLFEYDKKTTQFLLEYRAKLSKECNKLHTSDSLVQYVTHLFARFFV